jgi:hypothetical protein
VLQEADTYTKVWSTHNSPTLALVLPGVNALLQTWRGQAEYMKAKELEASDNGTKQAFKLCHDAIDVLIARLDIRFGPQNFNSDDQLPYLIATYLHPTYKNFTLIADETVRARVVNKVKGWVRQQLKQKFEPADKQKEPVIPEEVCAPPNEIIQMVMVLVGLCFCRNPHRLSRLELALQYQRSPGVSACIK